VNKKTSAKEEEKVLNPSTTKIDLLVQQIQTLFSSFKTIEMAPVWRIMFCSKERRSFQKKAKIAERKLSKQLNLQKFIQTQRMTTIGVLALLTGPQSMFCETLARMTVNSDCD